MGVSKTLDNHGSNDYGMHKTPTHVHVAPPITVVIVHVEKMMAIVLLCESAQQSRALMMILKYHKKLSMISMMLSQCPIACVFETYYIGIVSSAFSTIPIFPLSIHRFLKYLYPLFPMCI